MPTNFNVCPAANVTPAFAEPASIDSPDDGKILISAVVSFITVTSKPVAVSGSLTLSADDAVADVTILNVFVKAVAAPCVVPAADTVAALKVDDPDTDKLEDADNVPAEILLPDSYLSVFRFVKLASTSLLVSGLPLLDLNVIVAMSPAYLLILFTKP
tara:strand:+ start:1647 stop:2120 length:474 start_codon:yes stop_codon:yes gene_type:complete